MTAPAGIDAVIGEFGRAAGVSGMALGGRGTAMLRFETGAVLRLEYTGEELVMAMEVSAGDLRRLLAVSHPKARHGFKVRTGAVPKTGRQVLAVRLREREVTLPQLNAAFGTLWRLAGEIGGAPWA